MCIFSPTILYGCNFERVMAELQNSIKGYLILYLLWALEIFDLDDAEVTPCFVLITWMRLLVVLKLTRTIGLLHQSGSCACKFGTEGHKSN